MINDATGVCLDHIKKPKSDTDKRKYSYIRHGHWARRTLDANQVVYMSLDVTGPHLIMFHFILNIVRKRGPGYLSVEVESWNDIIGKVLNRLVDRILDEKTQGCEIPYELRNLEESFAALQLSKEIKEEAKDEEERALRWARLLKELKDNSTTKWNEEFKKRSSKEYSKCSMSKKFKR